MRSNSRTRASEARAASLRASQHILYALISHQEHMANDPHYFGESLGCQTCVEDRRTNSVRFANRHVPYEWAFAHTSNKMSIPITPEAVAEFLSGYADGYTNEMREEEFDDGNNKGI